MDSIESLIAPQSGSGLFDIDQMLDRPCKLCLDEVVADLQRDAVWQV